MKALLSGQAGMAVIPQGQTLCVIDVNAPETDTVFPYSSLRYLLAGATDLVQVTSDSRDEVVRQLDLAWRKDRALQLTLILLDGAENVDTRVSAADCLDGLLAQEIVLDNVANRLHAAPLPDAADLSGSHAAARSSKVVEKLLSEIEAAQSHITRLSGAWAALPTHAFADEPTRQRFWQVLTTSGTLRAFAKAADDPSSFALARIDAQSSLAAMPNSRFVFEAWLKKIQPAKRRPDLDDLLRRSGRNVSDKGDEQSLACSTLSPHEAFENVKTQKQAITELLKKGDWHNARKFAQELKESQLRTGDPKYAAKSLCDLAQRAKDISNCSLQLELALMAIETCPEDAWSHGQVADAYFCLGRYREAAGEYEQCGKLGDESFAATGPARILRGQARLDEALAAYERTIADFPDEITAWVGRAEVLRDMFHYDEALQAYERAIRQFPDQRVPLCGKAAVLSDLGSLEEALQVYDQCIRNFGEDVVAYCGRAHVLRLMDPLDDALDAFESAARKFPASPVPMTGHAEVLKAKLMLKEALEEYTEIVRLFPHEVVPPNGRAEVLKEMGRYAEALEAYDRAIEKFPHDPVAYCGRANVLKCWGHLEEALRAYDATVAKFPYQVYAWSARADLLKELGRLEDAVRAYDNLIAMPWNPRKQAVRYAKAAVLAAMGKFGEAESLLPTTEPRTRDEWLAYHIRGMILLRTGKYLEAVQWFDTGLRNNPHSDEREYFESALAIANLRLKKFTEAVRVLNDHKNPLTDVIRMHALGATHQYAEATNAYKRLQTTCPPPLVSLRDEIAARYKLRPGHYSRDWNWVFEEECRILLCTAA